jgi:hypothetical protein
MAGRAGKPIRRVPAGTRVPSSLSACGRASHPGRLLCIRPMTPSCGGQRRWRLLARRPDWYRMKQLDSRQWVKVSQLAKVLAVSWSVIQPSDALRATSMQLEDRYDLRAPDSFQAAALEWCEYTPQGRVFLTADQKLRDAALLGSFDVKQA